jgi:sugar phosphate permease
MLSAILEMMFGAIAVLFIFAFLVLLAGGR